jgi:hypothetical protein
MYDNPDAENGFAGLASCDASRNRVMFGATVSVTPYFARRHLARASPHHEHIVHVTAETSIIIAACDGITVFNTLETLPYQVPVHYTKARRSSPQVIEIQAGYCRTRDHVVVAERSPDNYAQLLETLHPVLA